MTETAMVINYNGPAITARPPWVKLEQVIPHGLAKYASVKDLYDFWLAAATGRSAQTIRRGDVCPVEMDGGVIRLWIDFYVWLSDPAAPYSLQAGIGVFGPPKHVSIHKAFSLVADDVTELALPYYFGPGAVTSWESSTYNSKSEQIHGVTISIDGAWLLFSEPVFGVVRISGEALGFEHRLTIEVDKGEDPETGDWITYELTDFNVDIVVSTADNEAVMKLSDSTLPECVAAVLTMCPEQENIDFCKLFASQGLLGKMLTVYYSTCTGEVLRVSTDSMLESEYCR